MTLQEELTKLDAIYDDHEETHVVYIADDYGGPHLYVTRPAAIPERDAVPVPQQQLVDDLATVVWHSLHEWGRLCIPIPLMQRYLLFHGSRGDIEAAIAAYVDDFSENTSPNDVT